MDVNDSTAIQVNWNEVPEIDQNGILTQYEVTYEPLMTFGVLVKLAVNTTNLSITLMELEEYTGYNISVRAYTSVGPGPYSVGVVRRTFEDGKKEYRVDRLGLVFVYEIYVPKGLLLNLNYTMMVLLSSTVYNTYPKDNNFIVLTYKSIF